MGDRLDKILVARGLVATRSRARDLIQRGQVSVGGAAVTKPGTVIDDAACVTIDGASDYVSRGGFKLAAALDVFGLDPSGRVALDVGASTGGFTEILLSRGATKVYAVDVGRDQLHPSLRADPRVVSLEGQDVRALSRSHVPEPVSALVADVSFISLEKALPAALALASPGAWLVALVKPQFEAGREAIGKGGIVRDQAVRDAQAERLASWVGAQTGWRVLGVVLSPIEGGSGNQEFLLGALFGG